MLLKNKQIFIAEDNLQNRIIFQMILVKHGAQVQFERWGNGSLFQLKRLEKVDVIILDLMLAYGVTGYDIFDQIRAVPEFAKVPIVAVSATEPGLGIPKTRSKGFSGFIAKPIDDMLFPQQIAALINGEEVWYAGSHTLA
jgi:CheY-like chemotaxis protein